MVIKETMKCAGKKRSALLSDSGFVLPGKNRPVAKFSSKSKVTRPAKKLRSVIAGMFSTSEDRREHIVQLFRKVFRVHQPANFVSIVRDCIVQLGDSPTTTLIENVFSVLKLLKPEPASAELKDTADLAQQQEADAFDAAWLRFLDWPLSPAVRRRVLRLLPDRVMPRFHHALRLADFLLDSYERGGVCSVLALHGVFLLMHNYSFEYPAFYTKLYNLLQPNTLRTRHATRFLQLLELFLRSGYLPLYLAAAFAKRLARLSLQAPTPLQRGLLVLVCNLTVRHAALHAPLCASEDAPVHMADGDPYDASETDPAHCGALNSCLWEVSSLRNHVCPAVCRAAGFMGGGPVEKERATKQMFDNSYDQMMQQELDRRASQVPVTFHRPQGLLMCPEDRLNELWFI